VSGGDFMTKLYKKIFAVALLILFITTNLNIKPNIVLAAEDRFNINEEFFQIDANKQKGDDGDEMNEKKISSVILDVPIFNQRELGYISGCEIISTSMLINYYKKTNVDEIASKMPYDLIDPNKGYRGDIQSLKNGFTIFPSALLKLVENYLGSSVDMTGCEMNDLIKKLNSFDPIVVWVKGLGFNVHAICLTGYNSSGFYYNDPWTGEKDKFISYEDFYSVWNDPIEDKIYHKYYSPRKALSI
jgi:uncharacterized protein YvpB